MGKSELRWHHAVCHAVVKSKSLELLLRVQLEDDIGLVEGPAQARRRRINLCHLLRDRRD